MAPARCVLSEPGTSTTFKTEMDFDGVNAAPLVDAQGRYVGVVTMESLAQGLKVDAQGVETLVDPHVRANPSNRSIWTSCSTP